MKRMPVTLKRFCTLCLSVMFLFSLVNLTSSQEVSSDTVVLENPSNEKTIAGTVADTVLTEIEVKNNGKFIRGIHLTTLMASAVKQRAAILLLLQQTELNAVVIDIKEFDGQVCIKGAPMADSAKTSSNSIFKISEYLSALKAEGIYTIARLVVYRDNLMPRINPSLAVKNADGTIWRDYNGIAWLDPYNEEAQEYILQIAQQAADLGFDEIQFDYIRFPSDGNISKARYSKPYSKKAALQVLVDFLEKANKRLKPQGVNISIDLFGLTTTATDDLGIGQKIVEMAQWVDYVSPMVYPSHYKGGTYGIEDPNKAPYETVYAAMKGAVKRIPPEKLRPWLQDFTMKGFPYRKEQVRAQIQACYDNDIGSWLLWNPRCVYTTLALKGNQDENVYEKRVRVK